MSVRCTACGRFIGHAEDYVFEFEPLSEFGPEKTEHFHVSCAASADTRPQGGDAKQAPFTSGAVPHEDAADAQPIEPIGKSS